MLRWLTPLMFLALAVMGGVSSLMFALMSSVAGSPSGEEVEALKGAAMSLAVVLGGIPLMMPFLQRPLRCRLGVDGRRIHVALPGGTHVSADAGQVTYDHAHLLVEGVVVATRLGNGTRLYAEGEMETRLAPLLARARRVGALAMLGRRLAAGDAAVLARVVYFAGVLAVLAATGAWRDMLAQVPGLGQ